MCGGQKTTSDVSLAFYLFWVVLSYCISALCVSLLGLDESKDSSVCAISLPVGGVRLQMQTTVSAFFRRDLSFECGSLCMCCLFGQYFFVYFNWDFRVDVSWRKNRNTYDTELETKHENLNFWITSGLKFSFYL